MARDQLKEGEKERDFITVYKDFFQMPTTILTHYDKMVFIAIKSYTNSTKKTAFPSINTLHKVTGISRQRIQDSIKDLVEAGFLRKERQKNKHGGTTSNLYTIFDTEEMCKAGSKEEVRKIADVVIPLSQFSTEELVEELKRREPAGLEKEPSAVGAAEGSVNGVNSFSNINSNLSHEKLQAKKHSMDELRAKFDYDGMVSGHPDLKEDINFAMQVIYDSVNTSRETLRIGEEAIPSSDVYDRLMDLKDTEIVECIYRVLEQSKTQKIRHSRAYLLKSLYNSYTQSFQSETDANYDMHHLGENDRTLPEESYDI